MIKGSYCTWSSNELHAPSDIAKSTARLPIFLHILVFQVSLKPVAPGALNYGGLLQCRNMQVANLSVPLPLVLALKLSPITQGDRNECDKCAENDEDASQERDSPPWRSTDHC